MKMSILSRIIISLLMVFLLILQTYYNFIKIKLSDEEKVKLSESEYSNYYIIFGKSITGNNNITKEIFLDNSLVQIRGIGDIIKLFLEDFQKCRIKPQEIYAYYFYYLIIYDLMIGFITYKIIRKFFIASITKTILRVIKIVFDIIHFLNLNEHQKSEFKKKWKGLSSILRIVYFYDILIFFDIIFLINNYYEYKNLIKQNKSKGSNNLESDGIEEKVDEFKTVPKSREGNVEKINDDKEDDDNKGETKC